MARVTESSTKLMEMVTRSTTDFLFLERSSGDILLLTLEVT